MYADGDAHQDASPNASEKVLPVHALADDQLTSFGRRRTAYPIDMTLDEVVRRRLAISARVTRRPSVGAQVRTSLSTIAKELPKGGPAILLGQPGSGKSMAAYQIALYCRKHGFTPLLLRATDIGKRADAISRAILSDESSSQVVLLLDGLDEGLTVWRNSQCIPDSLGHVMAQLPTLVTSRTRDFEESAELDGAGIAFDRVYELQPWDIGVEFARYVRRLAQLGKLPDESLLDKVRASADLSKIASRPLHARMLTFTYESDPGNPPEEERDLYSRYLQRIARVATVGLERRGCSLNGNVLSFWKELAWAVFLTNTTSYDLGKLIQRASSPAAIDPTCGTAAVDFIADRQDQEGYESLEFLHYSFYEWLVAAYIRDHLTEGNPSPETVSSLFENDLPREVRHYLKGQLDPMSWQLSNALAEAYRALSRGAKNTRRTLIIGNLIVYLVARSASNAGQTLAELLDDEREPFLANSLLSSLSYVGSSSALTEFIDRYESDDNWRQTSRGYVLYYYGDLPIEAGPPYEDAPPYVSCSRSLNRLLIILSNQSFIEQFPERQALDLLKLIDIVRVRGRLLSHDQLSTMRAVLQQLRRFVDSGAMLNLLESYLDEVSAIGDQG